MSIVLVLGGIDFAIPEEFSIAQEITWVVTISMTLAKLGT